MSPGLRPRTRQLKWARRRIAQLKQEATLPNIISMDSEYVTDPILDEADERNRLLIRLRGNRKLFRSPETKPEGSRGAPRKHGEKIQLNRCARCGWRSFARGGKRRHDRPLWLVWTGPAEMDWARLRARIPQVVLSGVRASVHQEFAGLDARTLRLHGARRALSRGW